MRQIFTLALLGVIVIADSDDMEFMEFLSKHNKSYKNSNEMAKRKANWKASVWKVQALNDSNPEATFALNFTADFDADEYAKMLGAKAIPDSHRMLEGTLEDELDVSNETRRQL